VHFVARRNGLDRARRVDDVLEVRVHELAGRVLESGGAEAVGDDVGRRDVADRAGGRPDDGRHAVVALAAYSRPEADGRRGADLALPGRAYPGQVVRERVRVPGSVATEHGRDLEAG